MISLDPDLIEILLLSMQINLVSLTVACIIGLPIGSALAVVRFPARKLVIAISNAAMSLPPVVVGLIVYLYLSRNGPLGWLELLYTPTAINIAQVILVTPIIISLSCQIIEDLQEDYKEYFASLVIPNQKAIFAYKSQDCDSVATVFPVKHHMWHEGKTLNYDISDSPNSQDLPEIVRITYGVCINSNENMLKYKNIEKMDFSIFDFYPSKADPMI